MLFKLPDFGTLYVDGVAFTSSLLRFPLTQIYSLLYVSMGLVGAVYAGVGLLSYLAWPRVKAGSITAELSENYPGSPLLVFSTVAVILAVVLTFPVQLFPAVEILEVRAGFRESMASATPTGGFDMLHDVETPVQPPMRSYSDGTAFKPPHWKKEGGSANLPLPRPDNRGEEGPTPAAAIGCGRGGACMSKVDEDDDEEEEEEEEEEEDTSVVCEVNVTGGALEPSLWSTPSRFGRMSTRQIAFRILLVMATFSAAAIIPNLGALIALIGAISGSVLAIILPALIDYRCPHKSTSAASQGIALVNIFFGALGGSWGSVLALDQAIWGEGGVGKR